MSAFCADITVLITVVQHWYCVHRMVRIPYAPSSLSSYRPDCSTRSGSSLYKKRFPESSVRGPDPLVTSTNPDPLVTSTDPDPLVTSTDPDPSVTRTDPLVTSTDPDHSLFS